ncbi:aspartic proteinase CDR1-like [Vicia villosa]|uniref:aspartic proteinase CDR1-like n=1 Tax=Vicia villosa TaxID=3911 RepID=UPI00273C9D24|nr:aspartic proteinase CDR1-like [Vicia villosa]
MSRFSYFIHILFFLSSLIFISHAINNGFSVELIHRDSVNSPFYNPTQTKFQQIVNDVRRSFNRADYINKKLYPNASKSESSLIYDYGLYMMSYSLGTPPSKLYGFIDTGSDLIWTQCKPCNICYNQTSPIFNPSKSSSYQSILCSSITCKSMEGYSCSNDGETCEYIEDYGRGTKTQGDLSMETLTLDFTSGSVVSFSKIIIGCGHTNTMTFEGQSSGIIGLGSGNMSMVNQLGSLIDGKFSYCLAVNDYYRKFNLSSKLNFGHVAVVSGDNVVSTPFDKKQQSYFLSLEAFSVGNKRIKFEGFKGVNSSYNIMIDSGTPLTLLPEDYYYRLESAVIEAVELERFQDPTGSYRVCYNTTSSQHLKFPEITAHFIGADVKLDVNSAFDLMYEGIQCFAFLPIKSGYGIFGNKAQVNHLIGYDLKKNIISFKPTNCTKY